MPTLYETLLPHLQAISAEGNNFSSFLLSKPVLDTIDSGATADLNLARIRDKILEKLRGYRGKRDHAGFNQIFEAYSEGAIYLAAVRRKGLTLTALPDGAKYGQTPDFMTMSVPEVGMEVKTLNVVDPQRTIDGAMDRGFEAAYEAEQESKRQAAEKGVGVGFGISEFAPHGEGADAKDAVEQTIRKIRSNVKAGQYADRPTFLVVSLVRLGLHDDAAQLRQRLDVDTNWDAAPSGHLYAVAANRLGEAYIDFSNRYPDIRDLGPLQDAGVLRDHDEIAALVFLKTHWHRTSDPNAVETAFRFYGIWNNGWNAAGAFTPAQEAEAKRVFEQLCDQWNDTDDSRGHIIPDAGTLHQAYLHLVGEFMSRWRGKTPDAAALAQFMVDADLAYFLWKAASAEMWDAPNLYTPVDPADVITGLVSGADTPAIFIAGSRDIANIPRLCLVKNHDKWQADDSVGAITPATVKI